MSRRRHASTAVAGGGGALRAILAAAAVLVVTPSVAEAQEPTADTAAPPAHVVGCYDVDLGPWTKIQEDRPAKPWGPPSADDSLHFTVPPRIRLSDEPVAYPWRDGPAWSAAAPPGALPTGHRFQDWRMAQDGGIHLEYTTGFAGLRGVLAPVGDGWRGTMEAAWDVRGVTRWERTVTLSRVDCASPPPVPDDSAWLLPRTVELEGGLTLTLNEPPPTGLPTYERPRHLPGIALPTVGLFAGADTVVMVVRDGLVESVQMTFVPPATPDALVRRLAAAHGAPRLLRRPFEPTPGDTVPESERPIVAYVWFGRVTGVSINPSAEGGFRVTLRDPRIR